MDRYGLRSAMGEFESEAAEKAFTDKCSGKPRVVISVEGYNTCLPEDEIKKELTNHFNSCGEVLRVFVPKDPDSPNPDRRAFVILLGDCAEEKALQLNGTDIGGWNALVKVVPEEEDEESARYRSFLGNKLMYDSRFWYGVSVMGYDASLSADEVTTALEKHFSDCGRITHVFVSTLDKRTNIYFSQKEAESRALDLNGSMVGGFKLDISLLATVLSNSPPGNGQIVHGYALPAHMIEFASEIDDMVIAFKKERGN